ncbi:MAG: hypothetical protein QXU09_03685 [Thermoproteota archaeon]
MLGPALKFSGSPGKPGGLRSMVRVSILLWLLETDSGGVSG